MAPAAATAGSSSSKASLYWRPTKIMNMRDLSKDDDFLSHLLVEKLGTGTVPLLVHKMDPSRRLPKTDVQDLLTIVRRLVASKSPIQHAVRQAVDELLVLPPIRYYLRAYTQKQINAFSTHASRYFELYNPSGYIEIAHTSRYSYRTGKSELCILATRSLPAGTVITELKGSMANLTEEEDRELKRTDLRHSDVRRDFSVIHSKQMKKNHLFLGPARFVNHDCDNNCELFREGKYITFRTLRPIPMGTEITAHYGDGYFGRKNRHCLCETCEKLGRGGYASETTEEDPQPHPDSDSDSDSESDTPSCGSEAGEPSKSDNNLNERRTRRGVYAILTKKEDESDESDDEDGNVIPLADAQDIPAEGDIELTNDLGTPSELTSLTASGTPSVSASAMASSSALATPSPDLRLPSCSSLSSLSCESRSTSKSPFRSAISTRRQKTKDNPATGTVYEGNHQLSTPPLSEDVDSPSLPGTSSTATTRITRSVSSLQLSGPNKGKEKDPSLDLTPTKGLKGVGKDEVKIKKEEVEPRPLRARPSPATHLESSKDPPPRPTIARGPDGKPLPTCVTCSNVLPVISVDSKVVWGLGIEGSFRKKNCKLECPRCMRHAAIYGLPWPSRATPHGFLPTPREEATPADSTSSKRFSKKSLTIVNNKLAAAASTKPRKRDDDFTERPAKRQKTEPSSTVEVDAKTTNVSPKTKEKKRHSFPGPATGEKRKRGRPRLSSPRRIVKVEEKVARINGPQPRNANGRFEKKVRVGKRPSSTGNPPAAMSHVGMAPKRELVQADTAGDNVGAGKVVGTWTSPRRKRSGDVSAHVDLQPRKRVLRGDKNLGEDLEPFKKVLPRPASNFKGGRLFSNPNPLSFALQAWAGPMILEESSEDEKPPVTPPEEDSLLMPTVVPADDPASNLSVTSFSIPPPVPFGALTLKPSPFNFAKRRWVSTSSSCTDGKSKCDADGRNVETSLPEGKDYDGAMSRRHSFPSRYTLRPQFGQAFSSYEKDHCEDVLDESIGQLTPISDDHPSALSPASRLLCHSDTYPKATLFTSAEGPAPSLVHAGWDSCSELSEI